MISPRAEAEASQRAASNPAVSAFVAASAGSGKTRLLTDRLLRLMVGGAKPERIFCLTFTKAGAAEMALRLRDRLGKWVTMERSELERELRSLDIVTDEATVGRARALFAKVLDLPGGMRIETIHAFCQSLLRRFPLEAQLSPHFQLMDDHDAEEAIANAREDLLATARPRGLDPALRTVAGIVNLKDFSALVEVLKDARWRETGPDLAAARRRVLGVTAADRDSVISASVVWGEEAQVREAALRVSEGGAKLSAGRAAKMLDWLGQSPTRRAAGWQDWCELFLSKKFEPYAPTTLVNGAFDKKHPELRPILVAEADRTLAIENRARAAEVAQVSQALCDLAGPMLENYEARKDASGLLEFDDLISRGTDLLVDPGADWVLYKLDGGLDHLLLDEVQDIAPEQWKITHSLTQEFFAGLGSREESRTVFAVGDRKQSIFSFQGADVLGFEQAREELRDRVERSEQKWIDSELHVSFRSTAPVLELVDAVFADPIAAAGVVAPGETLVHRSDRADQAGRVELWPLIEAPDSETPDPWQAPDQNLIATSAIQILAERIARWIKSQIGGGVLESRQRPLRASDFMILVRHRDALPAAIVRALKTLDVPVAGLDRMVLTTQPAVQDLMALGDALLLPQDDLTFACLMTSPLGGLNDDDLMKLAIGRTRPLWEELRDRHEESPAWDAAWTLFSTMLSRADYVSPHAMFTEVLGALHGREKLMARLGSEVAEPIDEFLNAALRYVKVHPPSLQGFLRWMRRSGAEIKREPEAAGDHVRILTVHGAKGLQAPVVILPDTTGLPSNRGDSLLWAEDPVTERPVPVWAPRAAFHCEATRRLRDQARRSRREEYNRLLYVALTRAEDRLVVCGTKPKRGVPDDACWYNAVARGFGGLNHGREDGVAFYESPQVGEAKSDASAATASEAGPPPAFLGTPPSTEPAQKMNFAPSRPEGVELGPVPASASPLAQVGAGAGRFQRGQLVHGLLQHLPALPDTDRFEAAQRFLERPGNGLTPAAAREIAEETMAILHHPALVDVFGPESRAEVPLTGVVGEFVVGGLVDRIAVLPDRVALVDFKTNRRTPEAVETTPVAYLRQMASYRAVVRDIFPGRRVDCALIWTREARVVLIPDGLLDRHTPGVERA